jgi:lantibiotic biosynthesis protein
MHKIFSNILIRTPLHSLENAFAPNLVDKTRFEEGLYLSSPAFWDQYKKKETLTQKEKEKLELSTAKYWLRSCTRCTPYATFAGVSLAAISPAKTSLVVNEQSFHTRELRLDMSYLAQLIDEIIRTYNLTAKLTYYPNNSLYETADEIRYVEYYQQDSKRFYQLNSIQKADYICTLLKFAEPGVPFQKLADYFCSQNEATPEESADFITTLIQSQVLVSQLEPAITGKDPFTTFISGLAAIDCPEISDYLSIINEKLKKTSPTLPDYPGIERLLSGVIPGSKSGKTIFQLDLHSSFVKKNINSETLEIILTQLEDLAVLCEPSDNIAMKKFADAFQKKFDSEKIPLAIALDADRGVGYGDTADESSGGNALINDLLIQAKDESGRQHKITERYSFIIKKYIEFTRNKKYQVEILEKELELLNKETQYQPYPGSYYACGSLFNQKEGFNFHLFGWGGPSGANLFARFARSNPEIASFIETITASEEFADPGSIYAEVVHLPQNRMGNVILRPLIRKFEIPYLGNSGAPQNQQIPIADILVSVVQNEVILTSKRLNKRIIPRLSSAHNFDHESLPVYRFLCNLQNYTRPTAAIWNWGVLATQKFLPRVIYKNIIVKRASWLITEADTTALTKTTENANRAWDRFRLQFGLPQRVLYIEADNELLIDFEQELSRKIFLHYLKQKKEVRVEEFLFTKENCIVNDVNGKPFTNELIIPFERISTAQKKVLFPVVSEGESIVTRKFIPGSEWLYFKIYCGTKTAEILLRTILPPFIEDELKGNGFEKFFFSRYKDDFSHIRIRFFNSDITRQASLQQRFLQHLATPVTNGVIHQVVLDTYVREIERYGDTIIEEVESLFFNDSVAVLHYISLVNGEDSGLHRVLFAIRSIDTLLNDFSFSISAKRQLLKEAADGFINEFGGTAELTQQLNNKYREHQKSVFSILDSKNDEQNNFLEEAQIICERSQLNTLAITEINKRKEQTDYLNLIGSLLHMFMNRLFIAQQRKYELLTYLFLERFYTSKLAVLEKSIA